MANYNVTITDEGAALLATVIATQGTITFTEARLSDTNYDGAAQTLTENTFAGTFLTTTVSASKNSATELKASAIFHSSSVTEPHDMYSLGIIGTDGNTTALVCVLTTTNPDNVEPTDSLSSTYMFNAFIGVSSTDNITVTGTAAGIVYDTDSIDVLADVDAQNPSNSDLLIYNGSTSKWTAQANPFSNENLLLNPFFTVNQKGFESATLSTWGLNTCVDMWKLDYNSGGGAGTVTKVTNGLHVTPSGNQARILQLTPNASSWTGKNLTLSVLFAKGNTSTYEIVNGTFNNFDPTESKYVINVSDNSYLAGSFNATSQQIMLFVGQECTIKAIKLELGLVSTLANDVEPNYTTELLKCQRYFYRIKANAASAWLAQCLGVDGGGGTIVARTALFTPVEMNGTPTIVLGGTVALYDTTYHIISNITVKSKAANYIGIDCATSGTLTAGKLYSLYLANANEYIDLIAN